MNTSLPPSDTPEQPDFNGFGSYRRKRKKHDAEHAAPHRSFRRIPRDEFQADAAAESSDTVPDGGTAEPARFRPFRKFGGKKPFGKKPFGKKPFGKKPFGNKHPAKDGEPSSDRPSFRDFADTIDEGDVPSPHHDRSFKHAGGCSRGKDGVFSRPRKPFGGKPHGKKPFGNFRPSHKEHSFGEDGDGEAPRPPRAIRRPYGVSGDDAPFEDAPPLPKKTFRKPFGKKPFGRKPFHPRKPFGTPPADMAPDDAPASFAGKPYGKKPFGTKPFGKGNSFGKKPFGRKPFGKGKPFGKKPFGPKRPPSRG